MVFPSGEGAAAPTTAPRSAFHTSTAFPPDIRQSPSAPARDAKYQSVESSPKRGAAERAVGSVRVVTSRSLATLSVIGTETRRSLGFETVATKRREYPGLSALAATDI